MKFTRDQFNGLGPFHTDDLNINDGDQDFMFQVFNELPDHIQGEAVKWGFQESLTREAVFEHLVKTLYGMSIDEYYDKKVYERPTLSNRYVLDKLRDSDGE